MELIHPGLPFTVTVAQSMATTSPSAPMDPHRSRLQRPPRRWIRRGRRRSRCRFWRDSCRTSPTGRRWKKWWVGGRWWKKWWKNGGKNGGKMVGFRWLLGEWLVNGWWMIGWWVLNWWFIGGEWLGSCLVSGWVLMVVDRSSWLQPCWIVLVGSWSVVICDGR